MTGISLNINFINKLKTALIKDLPGKVSHLKMASRLRLKELGFDMDTSTAIRSSVLILFYPKNRKTYTTFMLRQNYDGVHSGQVSFPGGRKEAPDKTLIETALREAHEEVNIDPAQVTVLGTLTEMYIPPSNYLVLPVIGYSKTIPDFRPDKSEVAQIIESDINFLFDPKYKKETLLNVRGFEIEAPYYDVKGHIVWGATAMILSELHDVIESLS
ncbi:MAG: CoA pyrophosphatase [Bacteroidales bacterium]|nr:CoA pyrophosphatase [Bacteroidales bacterium]